MLEGLQIFVGIGGKSLFENKFGVDEVLQKILLCAAQPLSDGDEILRTVILCDDGRAEFVVEVRFHQKRRAFSDFFKIDCRPRRPRIFFWRILDVHRHIIDQFFLHEPFQAYGKSSVCVQFYGVSERSDFFDKGKNPLVQKRLAARHTHAVQNFLPFF